MSEPKQEIKNVSKKVTYLNGETEVIDGIQYAIQDNGRESSITMYPDEIITKTPQDCSISMKDDKKDERG